LIPSPRVPILASRGEREAVVETSFLTIPPRAGGSPPASSRDAVAEDIYAGIARFLADARRAWTP